MGQTIAESWVQRGLTEGLAKGRAEGRDEGMAEGQARGRVEEASRLLLRLGRQRFGEPDQQVAAVLSALTDVEKLEQLTERVLQASSWQELLRT